MFGYDPTNFAMVAATLGILLVIVTLLASAYVRAVRVRRNPPLLSESPPRIEVWMPIRHGGLQAGNVLRHLLTMDYPNFRVRVILDDSADSAAAVVADIALHDDRVQYEVLDKQATNRGLICSSMLQFFHHVDPSCDLIVSCSADMLLPRSYFRHLASAMADADVGCTLGNRWYHPQESSWGSILRYLFNAGAVVSMWLFEINWAGAAAMRPRDVRQSGLLRAWRTSIVEDAPVDAAVRRLHKRFAFVAQLLVLSDDDINVAACFNFIERQLIWTRLYNGRWPLLLLGTSGTAVLTSLPWLGALSAAWAGNGAVAACYAALGLTFWMGIAALVLLLEGTARQVIRANGQQIPAWSFKLAAQTFLAIPFAFWFLCLAMLQANIARWVTWSDVTYAIKGPNGIRIVDAD